MVPLGWVVRGRTRQRVRRFSLPKILWTFCVDGEIWYHWQLGSNGGVDFTWDGAECFRLSPMSTPRSKAEDNSFMRDPCKVSQCDCIEMIRPKNWDWGTAYNFPSYVTSINFSSIAFGAPQLSFYHYFVLVWHRLVRKITLLTINLCLASTLSSRSGQTFYLWYALFPLTLPSLSNCNSFREAYWSWMHPV